MSQYHKAVAGDYMAKIALQYQFPDYHTIWDHPKNAALKKQRKSPNTLNVGDTVFIPDKAEKNEVRSTSQVHNFKTPTTTVHLQLFLKDVDDQPITPGKLTLMLGKAVSVLNSEAGLFQTDIAVAGEHDGQFIVAQPDLPFDIEMGIRVGKLAPVTELNGQKARLNNLGYRAGILDTEADMQFQSAVEEFQCDQKLIPIDGVCGPHTQEKLRQVYGC